MKMERKHINIYMQPKAVCIGKLAVVNAYTKKKKQTTDFKLIIFYLKVLYKNSKVNPKQAVEKSNDYQFKNKYRILKQYKIPTNPMLVSVQNSNEKRQIISKADQKKKKEKEKT